MSEPNKKGGDSGGMGPPSNSTEQKGNESNKKAPKTNKATGPEWISSISGGMDTVMGAVSFFTSGEYNSPAAEPPPPPPPPATNNKLIIGGIVAVVVVVLIVTVIALRKTSVPVPVA
jgi:hypothetical protein